MNKLKVWLWVGLLVLCPLAQAKSSVWVVEKEGKKIILAGSIHLLKPEQLTLPAEYMQALGEVKRVAFEVDVAAAQTPKAGQFLVAPFLLPNGTQLEETVAPEVWLRLQRKLRQQHLPSNAFDAMDAAITSMLLPLLVLQQQGYAEGIDLLLHQEAKRKGKKVAELETLLAQRQALMSLQKIEGSLLLNRTLMDLDDPQKDMNLMVKALFEGDVETMSSFLTDLQ